jgi:hypothetical protein
MEKACNIWLHAFFSWEDLVNQKQVTGNLFVEIIVLVGMLLITGIISVNANAKYVEVTTIIKPVGQVGGRIFTAATGNGYVFTGQDQTFTVLDVNDPSNPIEIEKAFLPDTIKGIVVEGAYAYVAASESGLRVLNISNPTDVREVGFYDSPQD